MFSNQKLKVALPFQKDQSNRHQKAADEHTSKDKYWLMSPHFSSQNVILPLES